MRSKALPDIHLPAAEDGKSWELFHENSKTSRYDVPPPTEKIREQMQELWESLPYAGYPAEPLPAELRRLDMPLSEAIRARITARSVSSTKLEWQDVATMLDAAYGVTRDNAGTIFPRPFRTVPSGGGLYPLEIYFHSARIEGLRAGLYHYSPAAREVRRLRDGDLTREISEALVQRNLALDTGVQFFVTGVFERSMFKYGDRGYRFVLLEAGHVSQNLNLAATALGLGVVNIGGFFDCEVDELLRLDGVTHSTVYMIGVGAAGA